MNRLFGSDGPVMTFLNKTGQIIIINLLWIVGMVPIVTIGTSTIAMYYAIVKTVRAECGYPAREFLRAYKANLLKGIILTLLSMAAIAILYLNRNYASDLGSAAGIALFLLYDVLVVLLIAMLAYVIPVLSRFSVPFTKYIQMIFALGLKYLPTTIALVAGLAGIVILLRYYPITVVFVPGVWCYLSSFLTERVMRTLMPPKQEGDTEWYYDLRVSFEKSEKKTEKINEADDTDKKI